MRPRGLSGSLAALGMTLAALASGAAENPGSKREQVKLQALRGPVKITAERADLDRAQSALYRGNVRLTSAELELAGDRLELRQPAKGEFTVQLTGSPAHLHHAAVADAPEINATAPRIDYDTRSAQVIMSGGATIQRGTDQMSSDTIQYNVAARRISASGVGKGQVQMVVQPPPGTTIDPRDKKSPVKQNKK